MQPKVSVVVPIYDCERYIEACMQSLLNQSYANFEALCINDASTDASLSLANTCVAGDSRFVFHSLKENAGQGAARNVALGMATGDIVVFLDADDCLEPSALEKIVARMSSQNLDELYISARTIYDDKQARAMLREEFGDREPFDRVASGQEAFCYFESIGQWMPHIALRVVRRSLLEAHHIRFSEGIIHEDLLFTFLVSAYSQRTSFLNEPLYVRRVRVGSTMAQPKHTIRNIEGHFVAVQGIDAWMQENAAYMSNDFIAAVAHRVTEYRSRISYWWIGEISKAEKKAYLDGLSPRERFIFLSLWEQPAQLVVDKDQEYLQSTTWKLGNVFTVVPRKAIEALRK